MVQFKKGRKSPWMVQTRDSSRKLVAHSFARKEDALDFEQKKRREKQIEKAGLEKPIDETLFLDFAKTHLRRKIKTNASAGKDESRLRNYWLEPFGARPLVSITSAEIKKRLDHIQFELGHTPADRNRHRALLHALFQEAFMEGKVLFNPVSRIPLVEESKKRISFGQVSPEDQPKWIEGLREEGEQYAMLGALMLWTGARVMAAAAIQYRDIDFETGSVHVRRLFDRSSGELVDRTKGDGEGGEDAMPLFPVLRAHILAHRAKSAHTRPTDFIACGPTGKVISYEAFRDAHLRVLERTGIPRFTFHAVRRAFATNAKRAGYTRTEIMEMLGHSSEAVTARYDLKDVGHLIEKGKRLGFGAQPKVRDISVNRVSTKETQINGTRRGKKWKKAL